MSLQVKGLKRPKIQLCHIEVSELIAWRKYNLALKFTELGLIDQAAKIARESVNARSDIARTHILLGFILLEKGKSDDSMKEFEKALELEPFSYDAKTGLGGALTLKVKLLKRLKC